jgi:hypothetical protein
VYESYRIHVQIYEVPNYTDVREENLKQTLYPSDFEHESMLFEEITPIRMKKVFIE